MQKGSGCYLYASARQLAFNAPHVCLLADRHTLGLLRQEEAGKEAGVGLVEPWREAAMGITALAHRQGGARNRCTLPKSGMTFDNHSLRLHPEHCDKGAATYPLNTSRANISMSVRADARAPSLGPVAEVNTVMFRSGNSVTRLWCPIESPPWLTHQ